MPYIRLSIAKPLAGQEQRFAEVMRKLHELATDTPGCQASYLMRPHDQSGEMARISIYDSEASATAAANTQSFLSLRSELHLVSEADHMERAFFTE